MAQEDHIEFLSSLAIRSVSLGYKTVHLHLPSELPDAQLGYSVDPEGNSLIGKQDGDWKENWIVIGYEDLCGDPIFIDTSGDGFPVYTAMHGTGSWEPELIAATLTGLMGAMEIMAAVSVGREHPVALEAKAITPEVQSRTLEEIARINPGADMSFWELWMTPE